MYFSNSNASKALKILSTAGYSADAIEASRPVTGTRYLLSVAAPHLPQCNGIVRRVEIRTPQELLGWGATQADVDAMNCKESAGLG